MLLPFACLLVAPPACLCRHLPQVPLTLCCPLSRLLPGVDPLDVLHVVLKVVLALSRLLLRVDSWSTPGLLSPGADPLISGATSMCCCWCAARHPRRTHPNCLQEARLLQPHPTEGSAQWVSAQHRFGRQR
ncbi:hypothetical protein COO60DRAFT_966345 [Scenedesmus sp. NREL 46B-D3]|nr:hypothetical protein COO60DRAFT_966345 [Scenedesmus sp. NREL 46B-D3]